MRAYSMYAYELCKLCLSAEERRPDDWRGLSTNGRSGLKIALLLRKLCCHCSITWHDILGEARGGYTAVGDMAKAWDSDSLTISHRRD